VAFWESVCESDTTLPVHSTGVSGSQYISCFYVQYGQDVRDGGRGRGGVMSAKWTMAADRWGVSKKSVLARTCLMDDLAVPGHSSGSDAPFI